MGVAASAAAAPLEDGSMNLKRIFTHLFTPPWLLFRRLNKQALSNIERAVAENERLHHGELKLVIEAVLSWREILAGQSARQRAIDIFARERVWDTEHNSGVLIYLLLADHDLEIVADRGIHARVGAERWQVICHAMEERLRAGEFEAAIIEGIHAVSALICQHFPIPPNDNPDELENRPLLL